MTPGTWLEIVEPDRPPGRCSGTDSPVTGAARPGGRQNAGGATTVTSLTVIVRQIPSSNRTGKVPSEYSGS